MPSLDDVPTPDVPKEGATSYPVDPENVAEMARLIKQARVLTDHIGLCPSAIDLAQHYNILDLGCGPGEWALEVARRYHAHQVLGIDISETMIEYAQFSAKTQEIPNARFQVMNVRQALDFPDASFDFINARLISGFMTTGAWPVLLRECFRLCKPGGVICSSEFESVGINTSPSLTRYNELLIRALRQVGQCFTSEGGQTGVTAVQARLLREAGFEPIEQQAYSINGSKGMPAHMAGYDNCRTAMKLIQPLLVHLGIEKQEELDMLYGRLLVEMLSDDFCMVTYFQTAWGVKPA
ncbi:MAG TPA: methyltransferase domain-containing protein [Ktedonosporobacter sp.]|nr:methyltransferase domain-containing protein [Ktedonosporobacter sp.]